MINELFQLCLIPAMVAGLIGFILVLSRAIMDAIVFIKWILEQRKSK